MGEKEREALALRAIVISGRAALAKATTSADAVVITDRVDHLLADLEAIVIRDGGDERLLAAIEAERRSFHE